MTAHRLAYDLGKMGELSDPGNAGTIDVTGRSGITIGIETTSGTETRTVAAPTRAGQSLFLYYRVDGGDDVEIDFVSAVGTALATGLLTEGDTKVVFTAIGDCIHVMSTQISATAYAWRRMGSYGGTGTA